MISKEKFNEIINFLRDTYDEIDKIEYEMRISPSKFVQEMSIPRPGFYQDYIVDLLDIMFDENDDEEDIGRWVNYFVYDLDFGREYYPGCVQIKEKEIDISTADKLYDFLVDRMNQRGKKNETS